MHELQQEVAALIDSTLLKPYERGIHKTLYHYTNSTAFKSIVESGRLWATDLSYLNDTTEWVYGAGVLTEEVDRRLQHASSAAAKMLLQLVKNFIIPESGRGQGVYVTCFCGEGDLLSQWRGYGGGDGYAIGLHAGKLEHTCRLAVDGVAVNTMDDTAMRWSPPSRWPLVRLPVPRAVSRRLPVTLRQVLYDRAKQTALFSDILERALSVAAERTGAISEDDEIRRQVLMILDAIHESFLRAFVFMNDAAFREECEWRLVYFVTSRYPSDFEFGNLRATRNHLTPYLDVRVSCQHSRSGGLPLEKLVIGPTATPNLARAAAAMLLRRAGYAAVDVDVVQSRVPLRI